MWLICDNCCDFQQSNNVESCETTRSQTKFIGKILPTPGHCHGRIASSVRPVTDSPSVMWLHGVMRQIQSGLLAAMLVSSSFAQTRNMAVDATHVLKSAKKVAVFINLGPPAAAPYRPNFERAKKQISAKLAKQKLQLVLDPADADIVLVAHEFNSDMGATASATTIGTTTTATAQERICLGDELKVYAGGKTPSESDAPIWSVSEVCGFSWPLNRAMDKLAKAMK